jgi:hypothetical protein
MSVAYTRSSPERTSDALHQIQYQAFCNADFFRPSSPGSRRFPRMTRIFSTLATCSTLLLVVAFWLGTGIGDARLRDSAVQSRVTVHFLTGVAALVFASLVHALVITYFMGTGRWLEETSRAYRLGDARQVRSRALKWRTYPPIVASLLLLIVTGALGGAADPASAVSFQGIGPFTAAQVHFHVAAATFAVNVAANLCEYSALRRNGALIAEVLDDVRRIRVERGLEV